MISFHNVTHTTIRRHGSQVVLEDYSGQIVRGAYVVLAAEPNKRQEFIRLCCGATRPQRGALSRSGTVSWPIGSPLVFRSHLNGMASVRFFCSMYEFDVNVVLAFLKDFAGLDSDLNRSIASWGAPLLLKFSLSLALLPTFDTYVVDSTLLHTDVEFQNRWVRLFQERVQDKLLIVSTTQLATVKRFCDSALIIHDGKLFLTDDVAGGVRHLGLRPADNYPTRTEDDDESIDEAI